MPLEPNLVSVLFTTSKPNPNPFFFPNTTPNAYIIQLQDAASSISVEVIFPIDEETIRIPTSENFLLISYHYTHLHLKASDKK